MILVIDDSPEMSEWLAAILTANGYDVQAVQSAKEGMAIAMASPESVQIILMDVVMPEMSGLDACRLFRATPEVQQLPIVVLTADDAAEALASAFAAGASDYIAKPPKVEELLARVGALLEKKRYDDRANEEARELRIRATIDGLTSLANRATFDAALAAEWRRCAREGQPLSLAFVDVDHFKKYNDHYGHLLGDDCLRRVATAINGAGLRAGDVAARYGGEEFCVLLPRCEEEGARVVAERIRSVLARLAIAHEASPVCATVTVSIGVSTAIPTVDLPASTLVATADAALYQAKEDGRNRVVVANRTPTRRSDAPRQASPDEIEQARLTALDSLKMLDTPREEPFDAIVHLAKQICDCEIATLVFVSIDRAWFKASVGLALLELPLNESFSKDVILADPSVGVEVADARKDPRYRDHAWVKSGPKLVFFCGFPVFVNTRHAVGTLCVLDRHPRALDRGQRSALRKLVTITEALLTARAKPGVR